MKKNKKLILFIVLMLVLITIISISCILAKKSVMVSQVNGVATKNLNADNVIHRVTLDKGNGIDGQDYLYVSGGKIYTDMECRDELTDSESIATPIWDGYKFIGYFMGDNKVIKSDGKVTTTTEIYEDVVAINGDITIKAKYNPVYTVNLDAQNGTQKETIYISYVSNIAASSAESDPGKGLRLYKDKACKIEIEGQKIKVPTKLRGKFLGYTMLGASTSQKYSFDSQGNFVDASSGATAAAYWNLKETIIDYNKNNIPVKTFELVASWDQVYVVEFVKGNGSGGADSLYVHDRKIYINLDCTNELIGDKKIETPKFDGYKFVGYYDGSFKVIESNGKIVEENYEVLSKNTEDTRIEAKYHPIYIVKLDPKNGEETETLYMSYISNISGEPSSINKGLRIYKDSDCLQELEGQKIKVPEKTGYKFLGYKILDGAEDQDYSFNSEGNLASKDVTRKFKRFNNKR